MNTPAPAPSDIRPERPGDAAAAEGVVARAFGPGRFAKVSYRVRDLARPRPELSFAAWRGGALVGTVRLWDVAVGGEPALFLGPIAVEADARSGGLGARLVETALAVADAPVLLVGDLDWFGRFGFVRVAVGLPGPVDPARVLATAALAGPLTAPPATRR